jgi:hypothetical protein
MVMASKMYRYSITSSARPIKSKNPPAAASSARPTRIGSNDGNTNEQRLDHDLQPIPHSEGEPLPISIPRTNASMIKHSQRALLTEY